MRKFTVCTALALGAVTLASGVVAAEPVPGGDSGQTQPAQTQPLPDEQTVESGGVHVTIRRDGDSAVLDSTDGLFRTVGDRLVVTNPAGLFIESLPLKYNKDNQTYPIDAVLGDHDARLTPVTTGGVAVEHPVRAEDIARATPVDEGDFTPRDSQELYMTWWRAIIANATGAVIGAIIGGVVGCAAGAVAIGASAAVVSLFAGLLPGAIVGCIGGIALVGTVGMLIGSALVTGPVLLWSLFQYFSTITTPCVGQPDYCTPGNPRPPDI